MRYLLNKLKYLKEYFSHSLIGLSAFKIDVIDNNFSSCHSVTISNFYVPAAPQIISFFFGANQLYNYLCVYVCHSNCPCVVGQRR